jgi:membrane protein DedA with SNARE-associated domain
MPALAGSARMPYLRFLAYNASGGIAWGVTVVLAGYFAGESFAKVQQVMGRVAAVALAVLVLAGLVIWHVSRRRRRAAAEHAADRAADDVAADDVA